MADEIDYIIVLMPWNLFIEEFCNTYYVGGVAPMFQQYPFLESHNMDKMLRVVAHGCKIPGLFSLLLGSWTSCCCLGNQIYSLDKFWEQNSIHGNKGCFTFLPFTLKN
jgi:hypothetical protein